MAKQDVIGGYPEIWKGGSDALGGLQRVLEDTELLLESEDPKERISALVQRASACYSIVGHAGFFRKLGWLRAAKQYLEYALDECQHDLGRLSINQLDVLSTVALRGIRICGIGVYSIAPSPAEALSIADMALTRCRWDKVGGHVPALLRLTRAEANLVFGDRDSARGDAAHASEHLDEISDELQQVRVLKRLGAVLLRCGEDTLGWIQIRDALDLAFEQDAKGQVEKIEQLIRELRRPWWHPRGWLIQIS